MNTADYGHGVADHERRIKADTELTDDFDLALALEAALEVERTASGNRAEVAFQFFLAHATAVIGNCKRAVFLVDGKLNSEVVS